MSDHSVSPRPRYRVVPIPRDCRAEGRRSDNIHPLVLIPGARCYAPRGHAAMADLAALVVDLMAMQRELAQLVVRASTIGHRLHPLVCHQ